MSTIDPTARIGAGVTLGADVNVGPNVVILGPAVIGDGCWIGAGCVLGAPPEITTVDHDTDWQRAWDLPGVEIGAGTVIRELSTVHSGSYRPTRIGAGCWLLNRVYVAHDCQVGDGVTLSSGATFGGHCLVGDNVNVGMSAVVHQRRAIGPGAMVGMGAAVTRDVPPYAKAYGNPVALHGVNAVGMSRAGIPDAAIEALAAGYAAGRLPADVPAELSGAFGWWKTAEPAKSLVSAAS